MPLTFNAAHQQHKLAKNTLVCTLNFNHHTKEIASKVNKGIGITRKLRSILPRNTLVTIYKSFLRPNVEYCDFIYDQPHDKSFCNNLEKLQYNVALAITGTIKGTSKLKIYEELGLCFDH